MHPDYQAQSPTNAMASRVVAELQSRELIAREATDEMIEDARGFVAQLLSSCNPAPTGLSDAVEVCAPFFMAGLEYERADLVSGGRSVVETVMALGVLREAVGRLPAGQLKERDIMLAVNQVASERGARGVDINEAALPSLLGHPAPLSAITAAAFLGKGQTLRRLDSAILTLTDLA